jgi:hypothetical protein
MFTAGKPSNLVLIGTLLWIVYIKIWQIFCPVILHLHCEHQNAGKMWSSKSSTEKKFLGSFAKLRSATITFVMFVCLSVHLSVRAEQLGPLFEGFSRNFICICRKSIQKIQVSLKPDKNRYFTWKPMYIYDNISLNSF